MIHFLATVAVGLTLATTPTNKNENPTHPVLSENLKVKTLPFGRCKLTDVANGFKAVGKCEEVMHYYGEFLKTKKEVPTEK
jgi:hypothetical protein